MAQYEISNYARLGEESRHNLSYWQYRDYAGIGPGAHGRLTLNGAVHATRQIAAPANWLESVGANGHGAQIDQVLSRDTVRDEFVLMGLRLNGGFTMSDFAGRTGVEFDRATDGARIGSLIDAGYLNIGANFVRATDEGRLRLNSLVSSILN